MSIKLIPNASNSFDIEIDRTRMNLKNIKLTFKVVDDLLGRFTITSSNRELDGTWVLFTENEEGRLRASPAFEDFRFKKGDVKDEV